MPSGDADSIEAFTGDRAAAAHLRTALRALRDEHDGTPLAERIDAVLDGRLGFRELAADQEFAALTREGVRRFEEFWAGLGPEERRQLAEQGEQALAETRRRLDEQDP